LSKLIDAENFARKRHKHQIRKNKILTPYSDHLEKVVEILKNLGITDENILAAGWLHDTIEDTDTDYDDILELSDKETADIVATLSKDTRMVRDKREIDYCKHLKEGTWQAQVVKFADMLANLEDLKNSKYSSSDMIKQAQNKVEYFDSIKVGLENNKKNIPNFDSQIKRLSDVFLQYGVEINSKS
jgi:(p)ppGpp synthase/HD superfamily hydrolase